jgi:DMSO/TMAO reductase YedYZ molybdopterin-dependent catalytic subunit
MRRRRFLAGSAGAVAGWSLDSSSLTRVLAQAACADTGPEGELLGLVPLTGDRPRPTPFGEPVGGPGLDTRVFTDLSRLTPERLITPTAEVFVRTAVPPEVASRAADWNIVLGTGTAGTQLKASEVRSKARPMGPHLIECAGNNNPDNFGLMSVAEWTGVPLAAVAAGLGSPGASPGVLVSGLDDETQTARTSQAGASWVLSWSDIAARKPFLATGMNGSELPLDHGAPVRLVVPGWYGCSWIKWVTDIRLAAADEPATTQMREFAGRTHQDGVPDRARDYEPPLIDLAATPIRVERRRLNGALEYRIVGIVWGGSVPVSTLQIRFDSRDAWKPLAVCPAPSSTAAWSIWTCRWRPRAPGTYNISLKCPDSSVRTRRLDMYFYTRRVRIDEV